jgi:hypothetical protein
MATGISADSGSTLFSPQVLQLLQNAIGGTTDQNVVKTETTNNNQSTTGTNNTNTSGQQTQNSSQTTQNTADVSALQQVFQQQQAGISPEMLAAIFTEGSKAAPGLVAATANAVGARSSDNTPLATALTNLSAQLTSKAADATLAQRNASAQTAAQIAQATGGTTTTGTNTNINNTNQTQNTNQAQTGTTGVNGTTNNQTDTQPNYGNVTKLLGLLLGGSVANNALSGLGGIGGALGSGTSAIGQLLGGIVGTGGKPAGSGGGTGTGVSQGDSNSGTLDPAGNGQVLSPDAITEFLNQYNGGASGGLSGSFLDDFLAQLQGDLSAPDSSPAMNDNWWTDEGWDQVDWANFEP